MYKSLQSNRTVKLSKIADQKETKKVRKFSNFYYRKLSTVEVPEMWK